MYFLADKDDCLKPLRQILINIFCTTYAKMMFIKQGASFLFKQRVLKKFDDKDDIDKKCGIIKVLQNKKFRPNGTGTFLKPFM